MGTSVRFHNIIEQIGACSVGLVVIVATACGGPDFAEPFGGLQAGASRPDVQAALGAADEVQVSEIPKLPYWGPAESLVSVLPPGSPFEQWLYRRDDQDYYVWFASPEGEEKDTWRVVGKATYPTGAVFEAR